MSVHVAADLGIAPCSEAEFSFAAERTSDRLLVDGLIAKAFGPGRFAKTAERLREGNRLRCELSICVWSSQQGLVAAVRQWPILIGGVEAVFLGPIAVSSEQRRRGLGRTLASRACQAAKAAGESIVLLVGDQGLFGPVGFKAIDPGRVSLPGPVDPSRMLWRGLAPDALNGVMGAVRAPPRLS